MGGVEGVSSNEMGREAVAYPEDQEYHIYHYWNFRLYFIGFGKPVMEFKENATIGFVI